MPKHTQFEPEAPPDDKCWELNFKNIYHSFIHNPKYFRVHWQWRQAMEAPGVWIAYKHEENGHEHKRYARFDQVTGVMTTNMIGCPRRHHHHVGSTCSVCGMVD